MLKPLTMWITASYGKFLEMGIPDHLTASFKQQLELDMEQQTGSKLGKESSLLCCQPAYLMYMQSASREMVR